MLGVADFAAVSLARAERLRRAPPPPPPTGHRIVFCLIAIGAVFGLVGPTAASRAQSSPSCTAVAAEIEALNARMVARSTAMNEAVAGMMAQQHKTHEAMEAQRQAGAATGLVGSLLGSIIPGGELVGTMIGRATQDKPAAAPTPPSGDVIAALADTSAQGEDAMRAGTLMTQYQRLGCPAVSR